MVEYIYDKPAANPKESPHWKALEHTEGDVLVHSLADLKNAFAADLESSFDNVIETLSANGVVVDADDRRYLSGAIITSSADITL